MTPDLIARLTAPEDVYERRACIAEYLANEGYELPLVIQEREDKYWWVTSFHPR